jgi:hypothetical protein
VTLGHFEVPQPVILESQNATSVADGALKRKHLKASVNSDFKVQLLAS